MKTLFPGLAVAVAIALISKFTGPYAGGIGSVTLAIVIGIGFGNILNGKDLFSKGAAFAEKKILPFAIALLGMELNLKHIANLGLPALAVILTAISAAILSSLFIGKLFGFTTRFSLLLGTGNAVCGSSAIAASAPVIGAEKEETGISVGVVNLLGTIGIFLLPLLATTLGLDEKSSGMLIGASLQAVGQVVAAGYAMGASIGAVAVLIKMGRVLMLGPVVMIYTSIFKKGDGKGRLPKIPLFIIGFFISALIASSGFLPEVASKGIIGTGKALLLIAMAGIGMRIKFSALLKQGPKALLAGTLISIFQISAIVGVIILFCR